VAARLPVDIAERCRLSNSTRVVARCMHWPVVRGSALASGGVCYSSYKFNLDAISLSAATQQTRSR
jgi:hypothetical protein